MTDEVLIVPLSDPDRWRAEHRIGGRPSQSWDYARALSHGGVEPFLAVVSSGGSRLLIPFFEREWRGHVDVATVLGLSGASMDAPSIAPWSVWREYATSRGWVAGYVQLAHDMADLRAGPGDRLVDSNSVFVLDLQGDPLARASEIIGRKIRRAERDGVKPVAHGRQLTEALVRLYPQAMERLEAVSIYRHGAETLRSLTELPGAVVVGAAMDGSIEAVAVFLRAGERAEYLCNGCSERGRDLAAWQIAQAIERLWSDGVRELNLGGGVVPGDGLYEFKARFHGQLRPLRALRQIYDPARYLQLCRESGADPDGAWFPPYRRGKSG